MPQMPQQMPQQQMQPQNPGAAVPDAKKSGKGGLLLGAAGGLAVGAAGTALVGGVMRRHEGKYEEAYEEGFADSQHGYGDEGEDDY